MDEIVAQNMTKYAVVKFLCDFTFSEIPTTWFIQHGNDTQQCWWPPRTANSAILIANYAKPDFSTWNRYKVDIIKYCCKYIRYTDIHGGM